MEIIGCGRGHYYNPNEHSSCPQCAKENSGADFLDVTDVIDFGKYASNTGSVGVTEAVENSGFSPLVSDIGVTEAVGTASAPVFKDTFGGSKVQEYDSTRPVSPIDDKGMPFMPVVGWLVCVEGPAKGRDYRIHSQYNYIGRAQHMDICISGDEFISAERAAILAYDDQEKFFSFGPGMGHNVVRVNGKMLMNAVVLNAYDELTIGKTKLMFVPLCGERFNWNDK